MAMSSAPPTAALVAEAISRIEERRDALDRLARTGMDMVERLAAGEIVEIAGRKPFADPARTFAVISRAIRICLALASRLDEALIALLRGGPIPDLAILAPETAAKAEAPAPAPVAVHAPEAASDPRARVAREVGAVIDSEAGDAEAAERMRAYVQERLIEGEDYDALLHRPWRVVVQAICSDLGIQPDREAWDDAEKFEAMTVHSPLAGDGRPPPDPAIGRPEDRLRRVG